MFLLYHILLFVILHLCCQVDAKESPSHVLGMTVQVCNMHIVTPSWVCVCVSQGMNLSMITISCCYVQWMDRQHQMTMLLNIRLAHLPVSSPLSIRLQHQKIRFSPDTTTHVSGATSLFHEKRSQYKILCHAEPSFYMCIM